MIALNAITYDPLGSITLRELPTSNLHDLRRRVNRQRTLDGGVVVNDGGFAHGDRTFTVRWRVLSEAQAESVRRMIRLYPQVRVSSKDGMFRAAMQDVAIVGGEGSLSLLVIERME